MTSHTSLLDIILNPQTLNKEFLDNYNEIEVFDLLIHLINNGNSLLSSLSIGLSNNTYNENSLEERVRLQKINVESRKLKTIRFLVFKLLSFFKWDLGKLINTLPSIHQEFAFTEFKQFCEQEKISVGWKNFSSILYHRWVLRYVLKSDYPNKSSKIGATASNNILDPYFVPPDLQDNLTKKMQSLCSNSINEIEKQIKEFENSKTFEVSMPLLDCFDLEEASLSNNLNIKFEKSKKFEKKSFLDDIYYELGKWYFIYEDYAKANYYFAKIKATKSYYHYLDGYILAAKAMISKDYKIPEENEPENCERKIVNYIQTIIKNNENVYDFDYNKFTEFKKCIQVLKKFSDAYRNKEESFLFDRLAKYLVFKINGLYESLDASSKTLFLNIENKNDRMDDNEVIEEGEINVEEELSNHDDPELMLIEATDPVQILGLAPSVKKHPLSINSKWVLPKSQALLFHNMNQSDCFKYHFILAKANELRNAKYFNESRVLYLSIFEDNQASNPLLADVTGYEMLHTDLEIFFNSNDVDERIREDLEIKCLKILRTIDLQKYLCFKELVELICLFLLNNRFGSIKEFIGSSFEIVRFCACLGYLTAESSSRDHDKRTKELWEFCLNSFIGPNSKFYNSPKISFHASFVNFICKLRNNITINIVSTCLAKIYNIIKDNPLQTISIYSKYDYFPISMPSNVMNVIDIKTVSLTVDETFRNYLDVNPNDTNLLKYYAEYLLAEGLYAQSIKYLLQIIMLNTDYFVNFDYLESNEMIVHQLINCLTKIGCHTQAAVLYPILREPDYGHAFKELSQVGSFDSSDDLYECIWDVTLLEFLINLHHRRGESERKAKAAQLISQPDLNINNSESQLKEAANIRKGRLFRLLSKLYI